MKSALFGGCFNPIHYGHLILAETALEYFDLDKVIFIPTANPPHKSTGLAPANDRYRMVKLAIENNPYFSLSRIEMGRRGKSYTYQTIAFYQKRYPRDKFFFLTGSDTLLELETWKKGREILKECSFLVGIRPGFPLEKIDKKILKAVHFFPIPGLNISGREIRTKIQQGKEIKYFLPERVKEYILENGLYKKT